MRSFVVHAIVLIAALWVVDVACWMAVIVGQSASSSTIKARILAMTCNVV